jgi:dextranase|nr:glycoside hydrolase family 66 protein [uncultured Flavobacterium sp.]
MSVFKYLLFALILVNCSNSDNSTPVDPAPPVETIASITIRSDKAKYNPGESVVFKIDKLPKNSTVRYKYLNVTLSEEPLTNTSWSWTPPTQDYKGYMVEVYSLANSVETILGTIGIDVSSDWTKFPRYGFLSNFGSMSDSQTSLILDNLKDYHINSLQFYDWGNKHHQPLKMDGSLPASTWLDIAGRPMSFNTVKTYIDQAHSVNIASMSYNLLYGAWNDYNVDGVSNQWFLYNDQNHSNINKHVLPSSWQSDILVANPANTSWQDYIFDKTNTLYQNLNFDGWHLDQLGDRGNVYDYNGNSVRVNETFGPFLQNLKQRFSAKKAILNAVAQYGQSNILTAPVDVAYTEVWAPRDSYKDLADIIQENNTLSNDRLNTVLAAYMNYDKANSSGFFNTPGVLLTDAVIFAFGGSHLELGEHMLAKEYFPNNNLQMNGELRKSLFEYYDFLVGYQNLLRDGGAFNSPILSSGDGKVNLKNWPPAYSNIAFVGKKTVNKQIIHLINFSNATSLNWRDTNGEQTAPTSKSNFILNLQNTQTVTKVWYASPDLDGGASKDLSFNQVGNNLVFKIPLLHYWGMIVIEY